LILYYALVGLSVILVVVTFVVRFV